MFKRILVPLDGTPQSNAALPLARTMARATGGAITLLRVLPESVLPDDGAAAESAKHQLERVGFELEDDGVHVDCVVRAGDIVGHILDESRAQAVEIIV